MLYIFWFLHQTTTFDAHIQFEHCCISFDSYIKPQQVTEELLQSTVVYLLIPTSNHNRLLRQETERVLYIFWFLHQTTTTSHLSRFLDLLYIFWFLHQTTTLMLIMFWLKGCISFDSYIKPQLSEGFWAYPLVVYLLIPTSNHNLSSYQYYSSLLYIFWFLHQTTTALVIVRATTRLYIFWFLHQTTTRFSISLSCAMLYIFWFLHQTTTLLPMLKTLKRCISFDSYIKPQPAIQ